MEASSLVQKAQRLTDLELAILLCLIADHHCIIDTDEEALERLSDELALISSRVFGLSHAIVNCSATTTLDEFREAIFVDGIYSGNSGDQAPRNLHGEVDLAQNMPSSSPQPGRLRNGTVDDREIANVVIAKRLHLASREIQIQALELIRTKRVSTHNASHDLPKRFLLVGLRSDINPEAQLVSHLVDFIFLSHYHAPEDGFRNIEEKEDGLFDDSDSSSVVKKPISGEIGYANKAPTFSNEDISGLSKQSQSVTLSMEVNRYLHNIIVFLRLHRAVATGISARATRHFEQLSRCLAPLHGLQYVPPALVAIAAKKVYPHRIVITAPQDERSMQWGSDLKVVTAMLQDVTPDIVIDDVLYSVEVPP